MPELHTAQQLFGSLGIGLAAAGIEKHQQKPQSPSALGILKQWPQRCYMMVNQEAHSRQHRQSRHQPCSSDSQGKSSSMCPLTMPSAFSFHGRTAGQVFIVQGRAPCEGLNFTGFSIWTSGQLPF